MKIHSLSTRHYADGGRVKCLSPQHNSVTADSDTLEVDGVGDFRCNNTTENYPTCTHAALVVSYKCPQAPTFKVHSKRGHFHRVLRPTASDVFLRGAFTDPGTHHRVATSASSATSSSGLLGFKHGVNDLVLTQSWMSGHADTWMTPQEQCLPETGLNTSPTPPSA